MSARLPDAAVHTALADFYRNNIRYANQQATHGPEYFGRLLSVMEKVVTDPHAQILEIGAGSAAALRSFLRSRPEARAVALELSDASLHRATDKGEGVVRGVAGSALEIPLRSQSVDAVVAFEVIEHLPNIARALEEALRVVRRPGHIIIGLPNHASLWTPFEDAVRGRDRLAFGVQRGRGAWRWWRRNAALAWKKRISPRAEFLYREPILDGVHGGDADAVYYAAPLDLLRFFRSRRVALVTTSAELRFGSVGRLLPVELQGATVMAWRVPRVTGL